MKFNGFRAGNSHACRAVLGQAPPAAAARVLAPLDVARTGQARDGRSVSLSLNRAGTLVPHPLFRALPTIHHHPFKNK